MAKKSVENWTWKLCQDECYLKIYSLHIVRRDFKFQIKFPKKTMITTGIRSGEPDVLDLKYFTYYSKHFAASFLPIVILKNSLWYVIVFTIKRIV